MMQVNHSLTFGETALAVFTLSGLPYALRHWEVSNRSPPSLMWKHRMIAVFEAIPILGGIAALVERTLLKPAGPPPVILHEVVAVRHSWEPRTLSHHDAFKKMWKNAHKAIEERKGEKMISSHEEGLPPLDQLHSNSLEPFSFVRQDAERRGLRRRMEDSHFFMEMKEGALTAVFDGHGGHWVATFANEAFQELFSSNLEHFEGNVHAAIEALVHRIHITALADEKLDQMGSTGVICFIDKNTHLVFTATIGDCEAYIYRQGADGRTISIPLSCLRNWGYQKEAQRAASIFNEPRIAWEWPMEQDPKKLYFPHQSHGVNVSRSIGDKGCHFSEEKPGILHKPKISVNRMIYGDRLILACDGLWDFVSQEEVAEQISLGGNIAGRLVDYAIDFKLGHDNVSVVVVTVE